MHCFERSGTECNYADKLMGHSGKRWNSSGVDCWPQPGLRRSRNCQVTRDAHTLGLLSLANRQPAQDVVEYGVIIAIPLP
jgi:hypothetical protein